MNTAFCRNCGYREGDKPALNEGDFHYLFGSDCPVCKGEIGFLAHEAERGKVAAGEDIETLAAAWWVREGYMPATMTDMVSVYRTDNYII